MKRVLAVDQGTTATKGYTLNLDGRFSFCFSIDHPQLFPKPGWVEHDPERLLEDVKKAIKSADDIDAVGIDNQGETVIAWDGETGLSVYNAIVWQDRRTADFTERLKSKGAEKVTLERAGIPLDPYFSASKMRWILKNIPKAADLLKHGKLRLGTSDSFFIYRLTGEYATDVTTASRTSLMNLKTCNWDPILCELFEIPIEILPEIRPTTAYFGSIKGMRKDIPVTANVVDQQAALMGHGCFEAGSIKATFGTGVFLLANVGEKLQVNRPDGILSTIAWQFVDAKPIYAVDAGVYNAGSAINWIRNLNLFRDFADIDSFQLSAAISRGLVFVPALSGLACPFWDRSAAGMWLGMGLETTKEDLCQAALEGIALRTAQAMDAFAPMLGTPRSLSVDGGLIHNSYFCQFLANITQRKIVLPASPDMTALGTGRLALMGSGLVKRPSELPQMESPKAIIVPKKDLSHLKKRFSEAVNRARNWR